MGTSQPTPWLRSDLQQLLAPTQHQQRLGLRPTGSKNSLCRAACPICAVTGDAVTLVITRTGNQCQDWWLKGVVPHHGSAEGTLRSPNCSPKAKANCLQVLATSTGGFSHFPLVFSSLSSTTRRFQLLAQFPRFLVSITPPQSWRRRVALLGRWVWAGLDPGKMNHWRETEMFVTSPLSWGHTSSPGLAKQAFGRRLG